MSDADRSAPDALDRDALDLAAALRAVGNPIPYDRVDWDRFHRQLSARAELPLARLRHPRTAGLVGESRTLPMRRSPTPVTRAWWEHAARWSRLTVRSALAAGVALVAVIRLTPKERGDQPPGTVAAMTTDTERTRAAFESAVIGRTQASVTDGVLLPSATDLLIPSATLEHGND